MTQPPETDTVYHLHLVAPEELPPLTPDYQENILFFLLEIMEFLEEYFDQVYPEVESLELGLLLDECRGMDNERMVREFLSPTQVLSIARALLSSEIVVSFAEPFESADVSTDLTVAMEEVKYLILQELTFYLDEMLFNIEKLPFSFAFSSYNESTQTAIIF